jgi:hypothetical protein
VTTQIDRRKKAARREEARNILDQNILYVLDCDIGKRAGRWAIARKPLPIVPSTFLSSRLPQVLS